LLCGPARIAALIIALLPARGSPGIQYRADESSSDLRSGAVTLRSNVIAWGDEFMLRAAWGTYRLSPEEILLGGGVSGEWRGDSARCLTARIVSLDSLVELAGGVFLATEDGSVLRCARLVYRERTERVLLSGPVSLADSSGLYHARADTGWYERTSDRMHLARQCTLFIQSPPYESIRVASDSTVMNRSEGSITARGSVSILGPDLRGSCQSLTFLSGDDRVVLAGEPSLEGRSIRCHAQRIVLQRRGGEVRQIVLEGDAWAAQVGASPADSTWDQAWGDRMVVWVSNGEPSDLIVTGSATAHHRIVDASGAQLGTNRAEGDSIILGMGEDALRSVRITGSARGSYLPQTPGSDLPGDSLDYSSQTLSYSEDSGVLVMDGGSTLTSGSARLTSETVRFSPTTRDMVAEGGAVLRDGHQEIKGEVMTFDVDRRQGVVRKGFTQFEEAFSLGERVARIDNRRLSISEGRFTSCDMDHPHFYITSPRMRVELDNKVVARSLVLWIHDVPVLYLPYFVFPIRRDRHSGFLTPSFSVRNILGLQGSRASVTGLGYYVVLGDYADAEVSLDWKEGLGWTVNGLANYALRYRIPSGSLASSYARREGTTQWTLRQRHEQVLPRGWRLTANINATRSRSFIDQETWDAEDRLDLRAGLNSDITFAKTLAGWGARASLRRDQQWITSAIGDSSSTQETVTSTLPEVAVSRPSKRIFASGLRARWYQEIYASLSSTFKNRIVAGSGAAEGAATGTQHTVQLSWQLPKLLGKFTVSPRAIYNETWIHRGATPSEGERLTNDRYGVLHGIGITTSTKLYGLWSPPIPWDVTLRHVASPTIGFSYTPDWFFHGWDFAAGRFSDGDDDPYAASGFGSAYAKSRRLTFGLGNVFQLKTRKGETTVKNDNLANLNFTTGYDLEKRGEEENPWSPLGSSLTLSPGRGWSWSLGTSHDPNRSLEFVSATSTLTARLNGGWNRPPFRGHGGAVASAFRGTWGISATHSYSHRRGNTDEPQTLRLDLNISPTQGWDVRAWVNYDLAGHTAMNKSLSLVRDLHCWQADFSWYQAANQWHYLLRVFVRAYPQSLFVKHEERG
jgi:hypothetical protein